MNDFYDHLDELDARDARRSDALSEARALQQAGKRLTLDDCNNPLFDRQRPVRRWVTIRDGEELAYEWVTFTDGFVRVGITYFLRDGMLWITAFEPRNARLFEKVVKTFEELSTAMKAADRKHQKIRWWGGARSD